jgi:MazG family protein
MQVKDNEVFMSNYDTFEGLLEIMDRLRDPEGCPWDREQTYASLRGYLLEEAYEAAQALDDGDEDALCEELGDLLFQIVFLSRIGKENGTFTAHDVVRSIATKMVRRHPHVFSDASVRDSEEVLRNWEEIKRQEQKEKEQELPGVLDGVPAALPALLKAYRIGTKASRVGFFWKTGGEIMAKIDEELAELREAVAASDRSGTREELGDLMFTLVMLARHSGIDPEDALEQSNRKFTGRFRNLEEILRKDGSTVEGSTAERLEEVWQQVKGLEADQPS